MRSEILRIYKSVHSWTGIVAGLALFIAFYAGALTLFKNPIDRWIAPPGGQASTPLVRADELIRQTLAVRSEAGKEFTLHLQDDGPAPGRLVWQKKRNDDVPWTAELDAEGQLRLMQQQRSGLARFVDYLHRTAGVPGPLEVGEYFMGVVSALYVVAIVSGLILVLPTLARDFLALRIGPNLKRMWLDAHNLIGVASLPFHLLIGLTAVIFAFHDPIYDVQDALIYGDQKPLTRAGNPLRTIKPDLSPAPILPVADMLARVAGLSPDFEPTHMVFRDAGTAAATVRIHGLDSRYMLRGNGFLVMSPVSGKIITTDAFPGDQGRWSAPVAAFFALHMGSFGGEPVRWTYFLLTLAGAFLFYSGNLLWVESRSRREGLAPPRRSTQLMASATVGICLGSVAGLALCMSACLWLQGRVEDLQAWYKGCYYVVFLGATGWALWRGPAKASVELPALAALALATIPVSSLWVHWFMNGLRHWPEPGVDIVALLCALAFTWMAFVRACRLRTGAVGKVAAFSRCSGLR